MFGDPISPVTESIGKPREVDTVAQRGGATGTFGNRRLIENAERGNGDVLYMSAARVVPSRPSRLSVGR